MKQKKSFMKIMPALLVACFIFTGCGNKDNGTTTSVPEVNEESKLIIPSDWENETAEEDIFDDMAKNRDLRQDIDRSTTMDGGLNHGNSVTQPSATTQTASDRPNNSTGSTSGNIVTPNPPAGTTSTPTTSAPPTTTAPPSTSKPTTEADVSNGSYQVAEAKKVLTLVNKERKAAGLSELTWSSSLEGSAKIRGEEIETLFSHTRPDGSSFSTVNSLARGENIAYGHRQMSSANEVFEGWMNSQGHRENIMRKNFGSIGIACYKSGTSYYWVQLFGQ